MSQFSIGRLNTHRAEGEPLPVVGGVDAAGKPTTDPAAILDGGQPWPMGFWKGSGLAILLDAFAAVLADGLTTAELEKTPEGLGVSQVFVAFQPRHLGGASSAQRTLEIVRHLAETNPESRYRGSRRWSSGGEACGRVFTCAQMSRRSSRCGSDGEAA